MMRCEENENHFCKKIPEFKGRAIKFIQSKWASEQSMMVYEDCITHCITPLIHCQWYLLMDGDKIIGCAGIITNDFISRMVAILGCVLYILKRNRGNAYSSILLEMRRLMQKKEVLTIIPLPDHIGLYEKFGFEFIGTDIIRGR